MVSVKFGLLAFHVCFTLFVLVLDSLALLFQKIGFNGISFLLALVLVLAVGGDLLVDLAALLEVWQDAGCVGQLLR